MRRRSFRDVRQQNCGRRRAAANDRARVSHCFGVPSEALIYVNLVLRRNLSATQPVTPCPSTLFPKEFLSLLAAYRRPRKFAFPGAASCTHPPPSADFDRSVPLPVVASSDPEDSQSLSSRLTT